MIYAGTHMYTIKSECVCVAMAGEGKSGHISVPGGPKSCHDSTLHPQVVQHVFNNPDLERRVSLSWINLNLTLINQKMRFQT